MNTFLFFAYAVVWVLFMLYAWNLSRRQARLRKEIEDFKRKVLGRDGPSHTA